MSNAPDICGGFFDLAAKRAEIAALEAKMAEASFWDNQSEAQKVVSELARLKSLVAPAGEIEKRVEDLKALLELAEESDDDPALREELSSEVKRLNADLDRIEIVLADKGKGIPDVELAMTPGWSTAPENIRALGFGAGMGLPNMKKYTDEFSIESEVGVGTTVRMTIYFS